MKALGLLVPHVTKNKEGEEVVADAEPRTIQTPFGDRSGVVIEPWLTDQWYVDAEKLAFAPMQAVRDGRIEIVPKTWERPSSTGRSEEHTSELQSLMRISYAVFCLKKTKSSATKPL